MRRLDLGVVGNGNVAALIDDAGDIAWWCLPRVDGDPLFCSLLEPAEDEGGFCRIELADGQPTEQSYVRNTAILRTVFENTAGDRLEVTDFAPRFKQFERIFRPLMIVRRLRPLAGRPRVTLRVRPRGGYGSETPEITRGSHHVRYVLPSFTLRLSTNASLTNILEERSFLLDRETFLILGADESLTRNLEEMAGTFERETRLYWEEWCRYLALPYEWQDAVIRAAITLKLCEYEDTGAIVAALTTSIPESPEGARIWDYRYCWLRDGYFTVHALCGLGVTRTMEEYIRFVVNLGDRARDNHLQPVYSVSGEEHLPEHETTTLRGYRGIGPVRIGNEAYRQEQNDVYGTVILTATPAFFDQRLVPPAGIELFRRLEPLGEKAYALHDKPDAGIWELRRSSSVHTSSSLLCWAGCDRLARIARRLGESGAEQRWAKRAHEIRTSILERAWCPETQSFASTFGGREIDASLLLLAELGLLAADDPRFVATVAAVERILKRGDYVFRYVSADDFGQPKNAFTLCTFWYVSALARLGRREEARELYEKLLARRTRLGLLSEHIDPESGDLWGNFPQTYSMVGIIQGARLLSAPWTDRF